MNRYEQLPEDDRKLVGGTAGSVAKLANEHDMGGLAQLYVNTLSKEGEEAALSAVKERLSEPDMLAQLQNDHREYQLQLKYLKGRGTGNGRQR